MQNIRGSELPESWPLCSHWLFNLTFGHSQIFKEMFAYTWLGIRDSLHTPNARWLTYYDLHILTWEIVELLYYWVFPLVDHTSGPLVFKINLIGRSKAFFWGGIKYGIFMCIISFDCLNPKNKRVIGVHFPLIIAHLPCFRILSTNPIWTSHTRRNRVQINPPCD
jgi:hypothetical protein